MNNFIIIYTSDHSLYKDFCKKKKGSISISYIDLLSTQEKYFVFGDDKFSNKVLECELFVKIFDSIKVLKTNNTYHTILYFIDTLDCVILNNFLDTIEHYKKKINISDFVIKITTLEQLDKESEKCLKQIKEKREISISSKESIHQMF